MERVNNRLQTKSPELTSNSVSVEGRSLKEREEETKRKPESRSRSGSCERRLELISVNKLPSRDNFSYVDDTTSPSAEKNLILSPRNERSIKSKLVDAKTTLVKEETKRDEVEDLSGKPDKKASISTDVQQDLQESTSNQKDLLDTDNSLVVTDNERSKINAEEKTKTIDQQTNEVAFKDTDSFTNTVSLPNTEVKEVAVENLQQGLTSTDGVNTESDSEVLAAAKTVKPKSLYLNITDTKEDAPTSKSMSEVQQSPTLEPPAETQSPSQSTTDQPVSRSSSKTESNSQFLIDLPSPAAALFYSDGESPSPKQHKVIEGFTTFRPPYDDENLNQETVRVSFQQIPTQIEDEVCEYTVIMTEGVVEKSALKKRSGDDKSKPREPKRVSWHEDGDMHHSYQSDHHSFTSDVSTTVHRSPVEECDSTIFGDALTPVYSAKDLQALENLHCVDSESDMTCSGDSAISTEENFDNDGTSRQIYLQYATSKDFQNKLKLDRLDSLDNQREKEPMLSPLETLESLGAMGGNIESPDDKLDYGLTSWIEGSPLENLERINILKSDKFDDEGEADDEDDEPNFPPPPPIFDAPDDMFSCESELPLPDERLLSFDLEATKMSSSEIPGPSGADNRKFNRHCDPLVLHGDLIGDVMTSESESDFDSEEATLALKLKQQVQVDPLYETPFRLDKIKEEFSIEDHKRFQKLPKPIALSKESYEQSVFLGQKNLRKTDSQPAKDKFEKISPSDSNNGVLKDMTKPKKVPPGPICPKPKIPPPILPKKTPIKQPQMGKGKHFDKNLKAYQPSTSSSSSSSSSYQQPPYS